MLDFTKYLKLNKDDNKIYIILKIFLFSSFCIFIFLFTKELIFPSQSFYFDSSIDSLANTISRPYQTEQGTGFDVSSYGDFDTVEISIILNDTEEQLPKNTQLLSRKSYLAFLSMIDKEKYTDHINDTFEVGQEQYIDKNDSLNILISRNAFDSYIFKNNVILSEDAIPEIKQASIGYTGFAPGTLLKSKTGVFVTDDNKKHAFQDEFAVKSLGYNFDNVIEATNEELSMHKKAKMFDSSSTHPFGTIFFANDADRTYVYDNNLLHKISNSSTFTKIAIIAQEASRTTFANCKFTKQGFLSTKYTCTLDLSNIQNFNGNTYQFILKDLPSVNIQKAKIIFSTNSSKDSLSYRIETIKKELNNFYTN